MSSGLKETSPLPGSRSHSRISLASNRVARNSSAGPMQSKIHSQRQSPSSSRPQSGIQVLSQLALQPQPQPPPHPKLQSPALATLPYARTMSTTGSRVSTSSRLKKPPSASPSGTHRLSNHSRSRASGAASVRASTTGTVLGEGGEYVIAVIRGKSVGVEIGLAAINVDTGRMTLTQVADSTSYAKTLHYLENHPPRTVLIAEAETHHRNAYLEGPSTLLQKIEAQFLLKCQAIPRSQWNSETGIELLKRFCLENDTKNSLLSVSADRYYALCAASALLLYLSVKPEFSLQSSSLLIKYETMKGQMFIDTESARNLELVQNNLTAKNANTLFSTLNSCYTAMGTRLLRSSILQPLNSEKLIDQRLDAVEELINLPEKLRDIRKNLKPLEGNDFDRLITSVAQNQYSDGSTTGTEYRIALLLQLRTVVLKLPDIAHTLRGSQSVILQLTERALSTPGLLEMRNIIEERINMETTLAPKGSSKGCGVKTSRLYAIKDNFNKLLDLARTTHEENVKDIMDLGPALETEYGISARLEWTDSGYRFTCNLGDLDGLELPKEFVNVQEGKRDVKFRTRELLKRNARLQQTQQEVFSLSDQIVEDLMQRIVKHIACLYACSEAIALIDMVAGFAVISASHQCVRPRFGKGLRIKNGRHPILETTLPAGNCVPNDVYASEGSSNFQLVQGPNMSGKSTYLRQIGLLTVTAMVGCFVPAEFAVFKIHDALLTRLSNDDYLEKSLSTFAAEMTTAATILNMATHRTMVLIDELGRGTAPIEGVGLSHAIAEQLIKKRSFVFFATHFKELSQTLCTYPGVVTLHLQVQNNGHMRENDSFSSTFQYKVVEGISKEEHYGLELAKLAALPPEVMSVAWKIASKLEDLEEKGRNASLANAQAMRRKVIIELGGKLQHILDTSRQEDTRVFSYLAKIRRELVDTLETVLELEREYGDEEAEEKEAV